MKPTPATLRRLLSRFGLVLALVIICAVLAWQTDTFLTWSNMSLIIRSISINGILAVGVTYVLLTGGVDLSLGSLVALTGVVAAMFARAEGNLPVMVPVLMGLLAGAACGLANGIIITKGEVVPFITTLGMMSAARGLAYVLSDGKPVSGLSPSFNQIADSDLCGVPTQVLILAGVAAVSWIILRHTRPGRYLYAVGGNERAARAAGINVHAIKIFAYTLCGTLCGLAGIVQASRVTTGQPNAGVAFELDAIAAVVIGGTSLAGGVGGVGGTLLGALLIGVLNNGLDLMGVTSYYQLIVKGVIIVGAAWLDRQSRK